MLKSIFTACLFGITLMTSAQLFWGGWGYTGNFVKLDGINDVVDDYNNLRDFLDVEMDHFRYLQGPTVQMAGGAEGFMLGLQMSWAYGKNKAEGVDISTLLQRREVRVSYNNFSFLVGGGAFEEEGGAGFGVRTSFGNLKVKTRLYPVDGEKSKWEEADRDLQLSVGPYIQIIGGEGFYFSVLAYYQWGVFDAHSHEFNEKLNGIQYYDENAYNNSMNQFGFSVIIAAGG